VIHPTAIISPDACVDASATIGPYCVVGPQVVVKGNVQLMAHAIVECNTTIGAGSVIHSFAVVGGNPQDLGYQKEYTSVVVGNNTIIREHVTISRGTVKGGAVTHVGDHCMIMAGAHVGHDCRVGNHVILSNQATLGGHVVVDDHAVLGGLSAVHQFCHIGEGAMVAGMSGATRDVLPYTIVRGVPASLQSVNRVRLTRMGVSHDEVMAVKHVFDCVRNTDDHAGTLSERINAIPPDILAFDKVRTMVDFIHQQDKRPLCIH
jgi:UDP-N-acetylglucosamine acyltransferase